VGKPAGFGVRQHLLIILPVWAGAGKHVAIFFFEWYVRRNKQVIPNTLALKGKRAFWRLFVFVADS
jgi:hypothetical protein